MEYKLKDDAWVAILSHIFNVDIKLKLESIDIDFNGLNDLDFAFLTKRHWVALEGKCGKKLTFEKLALYINKNDNCSISRSRAIQVFNKARQLLRHMINIAFIRSKIIGFWNISNQGNHDYWREFTPIDNDSRNRYHQRHEARIRKARKDLDGGQE
jgi:hypothetical protein